MLFLLFFIDLEFSRGDDGDGLSPLVDWSIDSLESEESGGPDSYGQFPYRVLLRRVERESPVQMLRPGYAPRPPLVLSEELIGMLVFCVQLINKYLVLFDILIFCLCGTKGPVLDHWADGLVILHDSMTVQGRCRVDAPPVNYFIKMFLESAQLKSYCLSEPVFLTTNQRCVRNGIRGQILTVSSFSVDMLELAFIYFSTLSPLFRDLSNDRVLYRVRNHYAFCREAHCIDPAQMQEDEFVRCIPILRVDFELSSIISSSSVCCRLVRHRSLLFQDVRGLDLID